MQITLNGEEHSLPDETFLNQLIEQLDIQGKRIAVEINQEIIPRGEHASYKIKAGDKIEIVHAIGGG